MTYMTTSNNNICGVIFCKWLVDVYKIGYIRLKKKKYTFVAVPKVLAYFPVCQFYKISSIGAQRRWSLPSARYESTCRMELQLQICSASLLSGCDGPASWPGHFSPKERAPPPPAPIEQNVRWSPYSFLSFQKTKKFIISAGIRLPSP